MKITFPPAISAKVLTTVFLPFMALLLASCNTKENNANTKLLREKSEQLHKEAEQLAADASMIQFKIKNLGSEDETGPAVMDNLEKQRATLLEEQQKLTDIGTGLTDALAKLETERKSYTGKYLKP